MMIHIEWGSCLHFELKLFWICRFCLYYGWISFLSIIPLLWNQSGWYLVSVPFYVPNPSSPLRRAWPWTWSRCPCRACLRRDRRTWHCHVHVVCPVYVSWTSRRRALRLTLPCSSSTVPWSSVAALTDRLRYLSSVSDSRSRVIIIIIVEFILVLKFVSRFVVIWLIVQFELVLN